MPCRFFPRRRRNSYSNRRRRQRRIIVAVFITSDLHFGHDKAFLYAPRGFSTITEHDATVISNWNSVIAPEDIVYVLGDVCLNDI